MKKYILLLFIISFTYFVDAQTIHFQSEDGLEITADVYLKHKKNAPFIVLFHQARWSRGEYLEIAPKLNALGFNCMAIDQRSGGAIKDIINKTHQNAVNKKLKNTYIDALPDMLAAIHYAKQYYAKGKLIIWGSSYSSALVIKIMGDYPDICDAGLAFAPGEYFERFGKPSDFISASAKHISKPIFITSAREEKENWWSIYQIVPVQSKKYFIPKSEGNHGSRALWNKFSDSEAYWAAVNTFLMAIK